VLVKANAVVEVQTTPDNTRTALNRISTLRFLIALPSSVGRFIGSSLRLPHMVATPPHDDGNHM
jgi:hypothetical protein